MNVKMTILISMIAKLMMNKRVRVNLIQIKNKMFLRKELYKEILV
jgi:hypothetical protein